MDKYSRFKREQVLYIVVNAAAILWLVYLRQFLAAGVIALLLLLVFALLNQLHLFKRKEWDKFTNDSIRKLKPSMVEAVEKMEFPWSPLPGMARSAGITENSEKSLPRTPSVILMKYLIWIRKSSGKGKYRNS